MKETSKILEMMSTYFKSNRKEGTMYIQMHISDLLEFFWLKYINWQALQCATFLVENRAKWSGEDAIVNRKQICTFCPRSAQFSLFL